MRTSTRMRATAIALACAALAIAAPGRAEAQNAVITGKVTSEFGQAVEGANVYINDLQISVGTNATGDFTINIPGARVQGQQVNLRVRAFGYQPQARPARITAGPQTFNFVLRQDVNRLAEIVVTGVTAGTEQKKLAFTVARVDERELAVPAQNLLSQLQGKVPGAQIVSTTGRPGAAPAVLLRGPKSINGQGRSQDPLLIVDGVILQGSLSDINPSDIESVEVVKGAAASSLYGSRAGNGVIQITTKSGKAQGDGVRFTARTDYGFGDIEKEYGISQNHTMQMDETRKKICVIRAGQPACSSIADFEAEALRVNELAGDIAFNPIRFQNDYGISGSPTKSAQRNVFQNEMWPVTYDPIAAVVSDGNRITSTLDATGRVSGATFFASASNYIEEGAMRYLNGYRRQSLRLNVDQEVGSDWTFGVRSYYSRNYADGYNFENNNNRLFFSLTRTPAGVDLLRKDKYGRLFIRSSPTLQGSQNYNPLFESAYARGEESNDRYLGNMNARYAPLSWLDFDANVSYDRTNRSYLFLRDKGFRSTASTTLPQGSTESGSNFNQSYNTSFNANARQTIGDNLSLRYTARYLFEQQDLANALGGGNTLAVPGLETLDNATTGYYIGSGQSSVRSVGMMAGAALEYGERYIADFLFRRDGSSLFGSANRWANYGRAAFAWRLSEESWFGLDQVSDLKLRASVGTAGGRPRFTAQYETYTIGTGGTLTPNTLGNRKLRPETVTETEIGVDAEVMNRFGVTANYAHALATDQILLVRPPAISGFNNQWQNAGTIENKTYELALNIPIIQRRNFTWSTRFNWDQTRSTITKLDVPPFFEGSAGTQGANEIFYFREGERFGTLYGRRFVTDCSQLPAPFNADCGGTGKAFQRNADGFVVWAGGQDLSTGITQNLWNAVLPGCRNAAGAQVKATSPGMPECVNPGSGGAATNQITAPWATTINWGFPIIMRDTIGGAPPVKVPLGNVMPDYRFNISQSINYKRLYVYGLLDASIGNVVWNEGLHWSLGDFMTAVTDQGGKGLADAKPLGYYWRAPLPDHSAGTGGLYDQLSPHSWTVEDASYAKIREVNVSYNVGPVRGVGDWTVSIVGRNLKTFTDYRGFDPEVGVTGAGNITGSSALLAVDAFNFPNLRTFNLSLSTRF